jgi:Tfp pilus assembly protein PilP
VARNHLAAALVAVLALAACGKSKAADADAAATKNRNARLAATPHTDTTQAAVATVATPPVAARPDSIRPDAVQPDSIAADSTRGHETEVQRETFAYAGGTRDPFGSLMNLKSAGPELADLQLVGVYQDLRNSANSVAVLREKVTSRRHKVRVGDQLGRLRVRQILARDVVFNIEDFGYERQETLSLRKQEDVTP